MAPDLRGLDQFGRGVDRARPDAGGEQDVEPVGGRLRLQPFARPGENFVAVGPAVGFVVHAGEARLADQGAEGVEAGEGDDDIMVGGFEHRSEEHTSELQSLMRISYAVFCLKKKKKYK